MSEIKFGEFETGEKVVEGFKDLLQEAATLSFQARQPNPKAQRISQIIVEDNLDNLNFDDVEKVFADAGLYFERVVLKPKEK